MFVVGGESLIDLISEPVGADGVIRLVAHQGGSPYNCAIALAKLGNDTGFLCPISADGMGTYLLGPLAEAGVKPLLRDRVAAYTTLAVVTFDAKKSAQYGFYRDADRAFTREGLIAALPEKLEVFQVGGFCPIEERDAAIWMDVAKDAARRGATLTMDPNVRPSLVPDFAAYKAAALGVSRHRPPRQGVDRGSGVARSGPGGAGDRARCGKDRGGWLKSMSPTSSDGRTASW